MTALYQAHATGLVRPLDLRRDPADAQAPAKRRLARPPRRWPGWLIPLAAAMAVVAVATPGEFTSLPVTLTPDPDYESDLIAF